MVRKSLKALFSIFLAVGITILFVGVVLYFVVGPEAGQLKNSSGHASGLYVNQFLLLDVGGIGLVFSLIGGIGLGVRLRIEKKRKRLVETGQVIYATIVSIEQNFNCRINGAHPYQVIAQYVDELTKTIYEYRSEYILYCPMNMQQGEPVRIYVDRENSKHYYMDINGAGARKDYKVERL